MIPRLHLVTDDEILSREDFLDRARDVLEAGGKDVALHLRGPRTAGRFLYTLGESLSGFAAESRARLLVNDRVDLALVLDVSGAHLGQRSMHPSVVRHLLGSERVLGVSVHGPGEMREVRSEAVDFYIAGTIFPSASHPGTPSGGLARIRELRCMTESPLLAIGGVTAERVEEVLTAGGFGVAVRSGVWDAADSGKAVEEFLSRLKRKSGT